MLRGTTLGWALEAGSNRLWVAGWRLWLPLLLVLDAVLGGLLSAPSYNAEYRTSWWPEWGLWSGFAEKFLDSPSLHLHFAPQYWSPGGFLGTAPQVVPFAVAGLLGWWWWESRRPMPQRRRVLSGGLLVPIVVVAALGAAVALAYIDARAWRWVSDGAVAVHTLKGLIYSFRSLLSGALGGVALWLAATRCDGAALVRVVVASAVITLMQTGREELVESLLTINEMELVDLVGPGYGIICRFVFPLVVGIAIGGFNPLRLLRRWPAVAAVLLAGFGLHTLTAFLHSLAIVGVEGARWWCLPAPTAVYVLSAAYHWAIGAVTLLGSLWLAGAIAALGQIGEDGAPVDAVAAQQQP